MARWIFDANVLIYLITGHPQFEDRIRKRLAEAEREGHTIYVPVAVVAEVLYVLEGAHFLYTREQAVDALEKLIVTEGIECQDDTAVLYGLEVHKERNVDFVDGYCAGLAKEPGITLLTNDRKIGQRSHAHIEGI